MLIHSNEVIPEIGWDSVFTSQGSTWASCLDEFTKVVRFLFGLFNDVLLVISLCALFKHLVLYATGSIMSDYTSQVINFTIEHFMRRKCFFI